MKTVLFSSLVAAALAAPLAPRSSSGFTIIAARSGSPIHLQPISASGEQLWIGKSTQTFCPTEVGSGCNGLTNSTTVLICGADDGTATGCSMNVEVPGGQEVFVNNSTGVLGYTSPHSDVAPNGAFTSGFLHTSGSEGSFSFDCDGANGLVACPTGPNCNATSGLGCAPWLITAPLTGVDVSNCLGFDALTDDSTAQAWEYE